MAAGTYNRTLQTTRRSIEIIDKIQEREGARLTDLVAELDLAKTTIYKHLKTLEQEGYLVNEGGEYHLGFKFINQGEYVKSRKPEYDLASEKIRELMDLTNEEVAFEVEDRGRLLTIDEGYTISSENRRAGSYHYMHNTAAGKAILAALPLSIVDDIVDRWGLPATTEQTITERDDLYAELETIRERGFAINDEELLDGLRAVGASISYPDGRVFGAIDISGPTYRMEGTVLWEDIPEQLLEACEEVEVELDTTG